MAYAKQRGPLRAPALIALVLAASLSASCRQAGGEQPVADEVAAEGLMPRPALIQAAMPRVGPPPGEDLPAPRADPTARSCEGNQFWLKDLSVEPVRIANFDASQVFNMLVTLGFQTVEIPEPADANDEASGSSQFPADPFYPQPQPIGGTTPGGAAEQPAAQSFDCASLPVIVKPPKLRDHRQSFDSGDFLGIAAGSNSYSSYGEVEGDISPALHPLSKPNSSEVDNLLVFYHPNHPEQYRKVRQLVRDRLDIASNQVYIEGMVLEVSSDGLNELGVQYDRVDPGNKGSIGLGILGASPTSAGGAPVISLIRDTLLKTSGTPEQTLIQIQALVSEGKAEVLSRPSVLTLNNRQATIQILDIVQFPIQEATITGSGDIVQSAFTFEAVRPGITLNLRPRISDSNDYVSLEIDVTVEALVTANNGEVRNASGDVIATKPGSSARRVQTYARIPDRTPIIIGGLISSDKETIRNRLPGLGSIPGLGALFGGTRKTYDKREVIIVLTPYVVGESSTRADMSTPKDTSLFDTSDSALFLDSYRIRAEDVYDLRLITGTEEFGERARLAQLLRETSPEAAARPPGRDFLDGNIPGGDKFVSRMVYDLVKRREFGKEVSPGNLIALRHSNGGSPDLIKVSTLLEQLSDDRDDAVIMVFSRKADEPSRIELRERAPGESWDDILWEATYGGTDHTDNRGVLLRDERDLEALTAAVISAAIIDRNGGYDETTVGSFKAGTILSIPTLEAGRFYLVDHSVARVFTDTLLYYRAALRTLEDAYRDIDALHQGDATGVALPPASPTGGSR